MHRATGWIGVIGMFACVGCSAVPDESTHAGSLSATGTDGATGSNTATGLSGSRTDGDGASGEDQAADDTETGFVFDVGGADGPADPPGNACTVADGMDAVGTCDQVAPADSFEPEVQWTWNGANGEDYSIVIPLVGNFTDDNDDRSIDLCDIPDVVVLAARPDAPSGEIGQAGHLYLLDGETGTEHFQFAHEVEHTITPAFGDLDGDGLPELVAATTDAELIAFEHTGEVKWIAPTQWSDGWCASIALADLDHDGTPEIIAGNIVADAGGNTLWTADQPAGDCAAPTAADLDGQPGLEVVLGHAAFHADGSLYYLNSEIDPGYPQVANLDDDPDPEVLVVSRVGVALLEHDGTTVFAPSPGDALVDWGRPAAIHDFDGDGTPEYSVASESDYAVYDRTGNVVWSAAVADLSGLAGGTAFDFLGDGTAEAMYADENLMYVFGEGGLIELQSPRVSGTLSEFPVVADIDNDGSAEILVVSNAFSQRATPTLQAIRDQDDRWIQARRIWNQHSYHVTNIREDSVVPTTEPKSWTLLNTFRTNAQIQGGSVCDPAG